MINRRQEKGHTTNVTSQLTEIQMIGSGFMCAYVTEQLHIIRDEQEASVLYRGN